MSEKLWSDLAWKGYLYWQQTDKKTVAKINALLKDIERNGCDKGTGHPEQLTGDRLGYWSRHIDGKNRLVYCMKNNAVYISSCKGHYDDK